VTDDLVRRPLARRRPPRQRGTGDGDQRGAKPRRSGLVASDERLALGGGQWHGGLLASETPAHVLSFPRCPPFPKGRTISVTRLQIGPRLSQAVVHGDTVYLAGIVAGDEPTTRAQTETILKKIDGLLAAPPAPTRRSFSRPRSTWPT
jgi:enamine deaminase RidA (YjgF/YER057c/UK114 family)